MLDELQQAIEQVLQENIQASDVGYDNTISELSATNVQEAIDEVNTKVDNINIDISGSFATNTTSITKTINAGGSLTDKTPAISKTGYYPIGIVGIDKTEFSLERYYLSDVASGTCKVSYKLVNGDAGNQRTGTVTFYVLWVKI